MRRALPLLALLVLAGCSSSRPAATRPAPDEPAPAVAAVPPPFTQAQRDAYVASFDEVWTTVRDRHWDPTLHGVDWNAARAELRPRVEAAASADEARAVLNELLGRLGQSHFGIIPADAYRAMRDRASDAPATPGASAPGSSSAASPSSTASSSSASTDTASSTPTSPTSDTDDEPETLTGVSGLTVRVLDGQALITRVVPGSPAERAGVRPGYLLAEINCRPVAPLVARLRESLHDTTLAPAMLSRAIEGRLRGPAGSSVPVAVLDADGKALRFDLTRIDPPGTVAKFGNLPPMPVTFERRLIGGDVGYITFSIFLDPPRVMGEFTKAMAEFKGTRGLVIDLRGNPGGLGVMAMGIGGWFVTTPGSRLGAMTTRDSTLNFVLNPRATPYTKPLAILIDPLSASTSEVLAGGLKDLGRARVFGETSAGAALPSQIVRLPSGDGFQFAVANYVSTGGQELEGRGVMPDVVAPPTREALLQGRDPALDAALEWIRSQ